MSVLTLNRRHIRLDLVVDDLSGYGYESVAVIDRPDGTVHIDMISPSGVRCRLYSLEDVAAALELDGPSDVRACHVEEEIQ